jgi:DNA segregation ATPase FtsK/SpoIIIE-like protein
MAKKSKTEADEALEAPAKEAPTHSVGGSDQKIANELWGILSCAAAIFIGSAIVSAYTGRQENVLGPFGMWLSEGLFYLFGTVPAIIIPATVLAVGIWQLRGNAAPWRPLLIGAGAFFELCILFALHKLPLTAAPNFATEGLPHFLSHNLLGSLITWMLHPLFGVHRFGPYFLFSLALFLTVVALLRVDIRVVVAWTALQGRRLGAWLAPRLSALKAELSAPKPLPVSPTPQPQPLPLPAAEALPEPPPIAEAAPKKGKTKRVEAEELPPEQPQIQPAEPMESVEEQFAALDPEAIARRVQEEQLAAFRARKNEPIKITAFEPEPLEQEAIPLIRLESVESFDHDDGDNDDEEHGENSAELLEPGSFVPSLPALPSHPYSVPSPEILSEPPAESSFIDRAAIQENSDTLQKTLLNFGVEGKVVNVSPGPVINRYEIELAPGVKVSKVVNLQDDISMAVGGQRIRIQAPIPGKAAIGIELPNPERQTVHFKHVLMSDAFRKSKHKLPIIIGKNISGVPFVTDIAKMPHILIAGQTGSGKSVCINSIIASLLMTKSPEELRMIMIDPKKVELACYEGIPHLLSPVVTESKEAVKALLWGVHEMERRYRLLAKVGARNIESFNTRISRGGIDEKLIALEDNKQLPFIVILVDELADLMMTASRDVEGLIQRIAQLARAVGIHLIVATQRPSVDIITGPIKANLTSRISFRTIQSTDSRTILGHVGAEKLLGMGDMLFLRNGAPDIERFHGAFISEEDVEALVANIRSQYVEIDRIESFEKATSELEASPSQEQQSSERDELFVDAAEIVVSLGQGSTSLLQRRMKIGYARAGRLMDELEKAGIVGPQEGSKPREIFIDGSELKEHLIALGIKL